MRRVKEVKVQGYYFKNVPNLVWHSEKFWMNDKEVKKVYNNGSLSLLLYGTSKKSIKKLRKQAIKCTITIYCEPSPF